MGALRLLLALSVVMSHGLSTLFGSQLFDGAGSVWTFFAISGFLITLALGSKYDDGWRALGDFYFNRLIRLYPAYWFWLAATLIVYSIVPLALLTYQRASVDGSLQASGFWIDHASIASPATLLLAAIANLTGLFADSMLYLGLDRTTGALTPNAAQNASIWAMGFIVLGQYWSIGVELGFYIVAPWVVRSPWRIVGVFAASVSGALESACRAFGLAADAPALAFLQAPRFLWMFMIGAMLAHVLRHARDRRARLRWSVPVLIAMYGVIAWRADLLFPIGRFPWWLFALLTAAAPILFAFTARNPLDRFLGDLSYPVYVNHFLVIQVLGSLIAPQGWLFASVSIALAALTALLIERPSRRLKRPGFAKSLDAGHEPRAES